MKVAIFLGSKSDSETMKKAADVLAEFGVDYKAYILSAHRAGDLLVKTIAKVEEDGCEVIIAGAGLSAALPGVIASRTVLPVIGVPLECINPGKSNGLAGMDALLSIVQMPPQILGIKYPEIKEKLLAFRKKMTADAEANGGSGFEF